MINNIMDNTEYFSQQFNDRAPKCQLRRAMIEYTVLINTFYP